MLHTNKVYAFACRRFPVELPRRQMKCESVRISVYITRLAFAHKFHRYHNMQHTHMHMHTQMFPVTASRNSQRLTTQTQCCRLPMRVSDPTPSQPHHIRHDRMTATLPHQPESSAHTHHQFTVLPLPKSLISFDDAARHSDMHPQIRASSHR